MKRTIEDINSIFKDESINVVPIYKSLYADFITTVECLKKLKKRYKNCFLLESVVNNNHSRYSFLGFDAKKQIVLKDGNIKIDDVLLDNKNIQTTIKDILSEYKSYKDENLPSFTGGLVGYISYDYIKYTYPTLKLEYQKNSDFDDLDLMLFDKIICFDHLKQKIFIIINLKKSQNTEDDFKKIQIELENIEEFLTTKENIVFKGEKLSEFEPFLKEEKYLEIVEKAKKYIYDGDIFQVVLSNQFSCDYKGSLLNTYRYLRASNPSEYMFYFENKNIEFAGASPETLVKLENKKLYNFALAGTRKTSQKKDENEAIKKELLSDPKELSEHNMLVDLARNDVAKVSKVNSVNVDRYLEVKEYSYVMHIASTISGTINDNLDSIDAIDSILPAGTLCGAPKLRASEIIDELEQNKRGIYGGSIGYIDFNGNCDMCIAIRLAYKVNNKLYIRSGAGVVYDSIAQNEHNECINKAQAVINAVNNSQKEF